MNHLIFHYSLMCVSTSPPKCNQLISKPTHAFFSLSQWVTVKRSVKTRGRVGTLVCQHGVNLGGRWTPQLGYHFICTPFYSSRCLEMRAARLCRSHVMLLWSPVGLGTFWRVDVGLIMYFKGKNGKWGESGILTCVIHDYTWMCI